MKEFDKQVWLEELADKYEVPVEQVMIALVTWHQTLLKKCTGRVDFESILDSVFKD